MTYEGGGGSTQVGAFEYDALGRLISSQLRYDADANAVSQTLKYYYDGPNEIAEYDTANNLSRRYVHGTRQVDERAIQLEGEYLTLDTYYYLLEELDTVAALVGKNGALVEAYEHDAYGKVKVWGYRPVDFDRDGDQDSTGSGNLDLNTFLVGYLTGPPTHPVGDPSGDGVSDIVDYSYFQSYATSQGAPPITLYTSSVGNPFIFTGRRMHWMEATFTGSPAENREIQYNRARHYDLANGRWLQRDPVGYVDGMDLYEYVRSSPELHRDPSGLAGLTISVNLDTKYLGATTTISVKTPKCACNNVRWIQFVVFEKWVRSWLYLFLETKFASWELDGTPWYTKGFKHVQASNGIDAWHIEDNPGVTDKATDLQTWHVTQDFETCALCIRPSGRICTVACGKWGHSGSRTWGGTVRSSYGGGSQQYPPSANMLKEIKKQLPTSYAGYCPNP